MTLRVVERIALALKAVLLLALVTLVALLPLDYFWWRYRAWSWVRA